MATRCINSLNDLDKISHQIYRKHSKVSGQIWAQCKTRLSLHREMFCFNIILRTLLISSDFKIKSAAFNNLYCIPIL